MAEGTDNEAEASAFMEKAQQLATLYSLSLAEARARAQDKNKAAKPVMRCITIGPAGKKGLANYVILMIEVARANDLVVTIARNSTYVNLFGFEEDIDLTQRLYGSLLHQMVTASENYLATREYETETVYRRVRKTDDYYGSYTTWEHTAVPKQTARRNFQQAFADRIGARLRKAKKEAETQAQEHEAELPAGTPGVALVLREKTKQIKEFYDRTSNARGSWKGGSRDVDYSQSAHTAGAAAAAHARLDSPSAIGGTRTAIGR